MDDEPRLVEVQCSECGSTMYAERVGDDAVTHPQPVNGPSQTRAYEATVLARDEYRQQAVTWERLYHEATRRLEAALTPKEGAEQSDASPSSH